MVQAVELVSRFKLGNQTIVDKLDQVRAFSRSYNQAKPKLRELDQILLSHFQRLNQDLFDQLSEFYNGDRTATKMIEFLSHDVKDIKIKYLTFIEKHSGNMGDVSSRNFPKEINEFSVAIINHLNSIEEQLLPLLKKVPEDSLDL